MQQLQTFRLRFMQPSGTQPPETLVPLDFMGTYLKTGVNIGLQGFLRDTFVMKAKFKDYELFFKAIMNHIPNNIRNSQRKPR